MPIFMEEHLRQTEVRGRPARLALRRAAARFAGEVDDPPRAPRIRAIAERSGSDSADFFIGSPLPGKPGITQHLGELFTLRFSRMFPGIDFRHLRHCPLLLSGLFHFRFPFRPCPAALYVAYAVPKSKRLENAAFPSVSNAPKSKRLEIFSFLRIKAGEILNRAKGNPLDKRAANFAVLTSNILVDIHGIA